MEYIPSAKVGRVSTVKVRGIVLLKVGRGGELNVRDKTRRWYISSGVEVKGRRGEEEGKEVGRQVL